MADKTIAKAYVQLVPSSQGMEKGIKEAFNDSGVTTSGNGAADKIGALMGGIIGGSITAMVGEALEKTGELVKKSLDLSAEYQQLSGGVEKIFDGMDTSRIFEDANNAYKNYNLSANEYLDTVTKIGSAMKDSMGSEEAYNTATKGLQAISDYASGTGKDINLLTEKYQALNRGTSSYQSLADNFSGILPQTSRGFLEQAQAAGRLSESYKSLNEVPTGEYQKALADALNAGTAALNLTGTTAEESEKTVSGSINSMKKAWENLLNSFSNPDIDSAEMAHNFMEALKNVIENVVPALQEMSPALIEALSQALVDAGPVLAEILAKVIIEAIKKLPQVYARQMSAMFKSANSQIDVGDPFVNVLSKIEDFGRRVKNALKFEISFGGGVGSLLQLANDLGTLSQNADKLGNIFSRIKELATPVFQGIGESIRNTNSAIGEFLGNVNNIAGSAFSQLANIAKDTVSQIKQAFSSMDLSQGFDFSKAIESFGKVKEIIQNSLNNAMKVVKDWAGKMLDAGKKAIENFLNGIKQALQNVVNNLKEAGSNMAQGLVNGFTEKFEKINTSVIKSIDDLVKAVKKALQIESPSHVMRDEVGAMMAQGLEVGWSNEMRKVNGTIEADIRKEYSFGRNAIVDTASRQPSTANLNSNGLASEIVKAMQNVTINNEVRLEGDAGRLFNVMQSENRTFKNSTGRSAFA